MLDIAYTFERFCNEIHLHSDEYMTSVAEIVKKLNKRYYDSDSETAHLFVVGSIGRKTAVEGVSDIDIIFELPQDVYSRFNAYESNGQSALLQEIKEELLDRYPNTEIKGDGQVVDVFFDKYTVELVPGFRQGDNSFKYPDSHDGGSWKTTDPLPEQNACQSATTDTNGCFRHVANMLRAWKNHKGFGMGGLLVDTMVYNYFDQRDVIKTIPYSGYLALCKEVFHYLASQDASQAYWFAPGSNQKVYNCDNGAFVSRAKRAHSKLSKADEESVDEALISVFGRKFAKCIKQVSGQITESNKGYDFYSAPNEEYIDDMFPVDITNRVRIDCKVTQDGFRPFCLSSILGGMTNHWLSKNKSLRFFIANTDVKIPYEVYWKVRNVGPDAIRRKMERGQIFKDAGFEERKEHTDFNGEHYVECYVVKNGVCVARSRIKVPIDVGYIDREHLLGYNES